MKTTLLSLTALLLVAILTIGIVGWQGDMSLETTPTIEGFLPLTSGEGEVEIHPELRFEVNTGCPFSTISAEQLSWLKKEGYEVDSTWCVAIGRRASGEMMVAFHCYEVDLPFLGCSLGVDSVGNQVAEPLEETQKVVVKKVRFVSAEPGSRPALGMDFLEKWVVEYCRVAQAIRLTTRMPDDYQPVGAIERNQGLTDYLIRSNRYYLEMNVDNDHNLYLIDTSLGEVHLKLPTKDSVLVRRPLMYRTIETSAGPISAAVDEHVWAEFGERAGKNTAYFYNDNGAQYAINPFSFFTQDVVLDFPGQQLHLRPHYKMQRHTLVAN
ncbi:MAG: hypothetical protein LIO90_05325 [Bacteroidales bacterium]|nr:hypothetical protein [Bacteroidales bacterium]